MEPRTLTHALSNLPPINRLGKEGDTSSVSGGHSSVHRTCPRFMWTKLEQSEVAFQSQETGGPRQGTVGGVPAGPQTCCVALGKSPPLFWAFKINSSGKCEGRAGWPPRTPQLTPSEPVCDICRSRPLIISKVGFRV